MRTGGYVEMQMPVVQATVDYSKKDGPQHSHIPIIATSPMKYPFSYLNHITHLEYISTHPTVQYSTLVIITSTYHFKIHY